MGRILWLLALVSVLGCFSGGISPDSLDYPTEEPAVQDLAGNYLPTAETRKDIRERGGYPEREISIQLSADGTATITNIPDWWLDLSGKPSGGFNTQTGRWKPIRKQEWWALGLEFLSPPLSMSTSIDIVGAKPPYMLRIYLGDPDEGDAMVFAKPE